MKRLERDTIATRRRWFIWSAAASLVGLIVGCGGGLTPEQIEAMSKLQAIGGRINYQGGGYKADMRGSVVEDKDLVHLKKIPNLTSLDLRGTRVTDAAIEHIRPIKTLRYIKVAGTKISQDGIAELQKEFPEASVRY